MKKKSLLFLTLAIALFMVFTLVGCTESYAQAPIAGDYSDKEIVSESGLLTEVRLGDKYYLYFVNGVAGQTITDNSFGAVTKGAIARVELTGKNGDPKPSSVVIVVPKNVYATDVESSFAIRGNYIYYSTPSVVKDKDGKAKSTEMVLMRTTLDGAKTEEIKTFNTEDGGFSNLYRVTENAIVYHYQNKISRVDLNSSNFATSVVVEEVAAFKFVTGADYMLYTKANEVKEEYSNRVLMLPFSATKEEDAKVLLNKAAYGENLLHKDGYAITITAADKAGDTLNLYYSKADQGTNVTSTGIYRYAFDVKNGFEGNNYKFDFAKEERMTSKDGKAYTAFQFIDENSMFATDANGIYFLVKETNTVGSLTFHWKVLKEEVTEKSVNIVVAGAKMFRYEETNGGVGKIIYLNGTKLQERQLFTLDANGVRTISPNNSNDLYTISATTSWLNYQLVGKNLYFINSNAGNYTYYIDTTTFAVRADAKLYSNILLSKMTNADKLALLTVKSTTK